MREDCGGYARRRRRRKSKSKVGTLRVRQKFNEKAQQTSCEASDFWGHLRTDFLNDQRLRHTNQTAGDLQLQFHISQLKQIFNCILTWRDNISLSCLNTELLSWCNCIKRAKQIKQKTIWLQQVQLYILQMKHIWYTHEEASFNCPVLTHNH